MFQSAPTACVLIIGNEILSGRTVDVNLNFIAKKLDERGIYLKEARVLLDDVGEIASVLQQVRSLYDLVFTTGGVGVTHDDVTPLAVAQAFEKPLKLHQVAVERLKNFYGSQNVTPTRLKMAQLPEGATLMEGDGFLGGFFLENVYVFAGVPHIMQQLFEKLWPDLPKGPAFYTSSVSCSLMESQLAEGLTQIQADFPGVALGSYPFGQAEKRGTLLVARGQDQGIIAQACQAVVSLIQSLGGQALEIKE